MGFGSLFLGFMFLYDFQIALRHTGMDGAYAMIDIFPDAIGWVLLFLGLGTLSKKAEGFEQIRKAPVLFFVLSLFTLAKDTLFFSVFYSEQGRQIFAGRALDVSVHLLELAFIYVLFRQTARFCRKQGEDRLSGAHALMPRIALVEGGLYLLTRLVRLLPVPVSFTAVANVISRLDYLFLVFLIWYGTICLLRSLFRLSDS